MLLLVVVVIGQTGLLQKKPTTNLSRCCCWGLLSSYACGGYENASIAHSLRIVWDRMVWQEARGKLVYPGIVKLKLFFLFFQASINWKKFRFFLLVASFFRCCSKKKEKNSMVKILQSQIFFFLPRLLSQQIRMTLGTIPLSQCLLVGERFSSISLEAITFLGFVSSLSCKDSVVG